ncbi:MAG: ATP-binding protein, partial [Candidatus Zixiibacteriota bacterium]
LAARISLPYLLIGILYITLSDQATSYLVTESPTANSITAVQTAKGWVFVLITASILHLLIYRLLNSIRRSRIELAAQEGKYRSLFENTPVSIWVVDFSNVRNAIIAQIELGGADPRQYWSQHEDQFRNLIHAAQIRDVNQATLTLFDATSPKQLNDEIAFVLSEESCDSILGIVFEVLAGSDRKIWEMQVRSLSQRDLTVMMSLTIPPGGDATWSEVYLMMLDVTEQTKSAYELEVNHRQLLEAQRIAKTGSWEWNLDEDKIILSEQLYSIFEISASGFTGTYDAFIALIHPDDREVMNNSLNELRTKGSGYTNPYRIVRPSGEIRYVITRSETVQSKDGRVGRVIGLVQDVTDRRREEEERNQLETQLRQAQKLESLGALAGGIAHDFNNILTPLYGYTELVMQELDSKSRTHEDLSHVMKAAVRGKELVKQILAFSKQIEQERKPLLLHHIVNEVVKLLRASVPPNIEITRRCDVEIDAIIADPVQIHQVIMNLCVNACYAMRERGGNLRLNIDVQKIDHAQASAIGEVPTGRYVRLCVIDSGMGMDEATQARAFDPFFTTKPDGEGTGLGLSVSRQIILSHKGTITVASRIGQGTTFTVLLPLTQSESHDQELKYAPLNHGTGRILFVDDETEIANLAKQMLRRLGYEVETAHNYGEAMHKIENSKPFDILITDQMMPGKSGIQLAIDLRTRNVNIPVILLTGDGVGLSEEMAQRCGIDAFLSKPFGGFELSQVIRRVVRTPQAQSV